MNESEVATEAQDNYVQSDEEDSESDDEDSRHRGRFRTERTMSSSAHLSKPQNTAENVIFLIILVTSVSLLSCAQ